MNDIMSGSMAISGSVKIKQSVCEVKPFSLNVMGQITCDGIPFLIATRTNMFGVTSEKPWDKDLGKILVEALNDTYTSGYEKDRFTYE